MTFSHNARQQLKLNNFSSGCRWLQLKMLVVSPNTGLFTIYFLFIFLMYLCASNEINRTHGQGHVQAHFLLNIKHKL